MGEIAGYTVVKQVSAGQTSLERVQVLSIRTGKRHTHVLLVEEERISAVKTVVLSGPEASQTGRTTQLTKRGLKIYIVRGIHTLEAVVACATVGTPFLTGLTSMGGGIRVEGEGTCGEAGGVEEEHGCLTLCAVSGVDTVETVCLAESADHG